MELYGEEFDIKNKFMNEYDEEKDNEKDTEFLSGNDIENQDDFEAWERFCQ